MTRVLALADTPFHARALSENHELLFYRIKQLQSEEHSLERFELIYERLRDGADLSAVDLVIAEFIESLPILYSMRRDGFDCPAVMIPHSNAYPPNILTYFVLLSRYPHPQDVVFCGSDFAVDGFRRMVGLDALALPTFGLSSRYRPLDREQSRELLGFAPGERIALYTGRLAPDKGIAEVLDVTSSLDVTLAMSMTHIDPQYFNRLSPRLVDVRLFYRLSPSAMVVLYNAADVFVSAATSVFETYGKSPLESIACGTPVALPDWDGFPEYVEPWNGRLASVDFGVEREDTVFGLARVDTAALAEAAWELLELGGVAEGELAARWGYASAIAAGVEEIDRRIADPAGVEGWPRDLDRTRFAPSVLRFLDHAGVSSFEDIERIADEFLTQRDKGDPSVLRLLHDELFSA